ncbi:hypothetical protein HELRODRAFT_164973 [Helobdella robusta]|uniref:Uncharacterized protein n=1 Tax=Helobdella robusta TaxID=6412 RepID=T1EW17_HELRO|nr:hypothetical protein HELRODRAFT_164973 [Helobdella robusta]ESN92842.1 hypothetical protein HELRODRAFT_164973 [Helobdella robusta]
MFVQIPCYKHICERGDKNRYTPKILSKISNADDLLDKSISNLKNELSTTWSSTVKKNIDAVSNEVKTVKNTIDTVNDDKECENNIVLFNLSESETVAKDRDVAMSLLKFWQFQDNEKKATIFVHLSSSG